MKLAEFQKIADILAKEHKIRVKNGESWASNLQLREVYYKKEDIYNLSEDHILGLLLHEIAHIHYTSDVGTITKDRELIMSALNMVEDVSIEHIIGKDYPNAEEILESTRQEVLDKLIGILPKLKIPVHEKSLLYGAIRFEGRGYTNGTEPYEKIGEQVATIMKREKTLIYNRKHTKELLPVVKEIVDLIIKHAGQPTEDDKHKMSGCMYGHAHEGEHQGTAKRKVINTLKGGNGWKEGIMINDKIQFVDAIADQALAMGKKLRTILKRNNAMEYGGRFRTGKLKAKRMVRIKALKDRRPFSRRIIKSNQSYAFAVASDISGSMFGHGSKINPGDYALSSLHMVAEALRYAGIPRSMIVFGDEAKVASPMGKNAIKWEQLVDLNLLRRAQSSGTDISKAINIAAQELNKTKAERKIMIILTDGQSDLPEMRKQHKIATEAGIECLGITIGGDGYGYMNEVFKKNNRQIEDTRNISLIGKAFIDILKSSITKST